MADQHLADEERAAISCETQGHFPGPGEKCVFCGHPMLVEGDDSPVGLLKRFVKAWEGHGENMDRLCEIARRVIEEQPRG